MAAAVRRFWRLQHPSSSPGAPAYRSIRLGRRGPAAGCHRQRPARGCRPPAAGRDEWDNWQSGGRGSFSSSDEDDEDEPDLDLFPEETSGDPEFIIENVLATGLIALAALAAGLILLKLLIVAYALISAAVRYTVIGVLLAIGLVVFQPGRWWF